MIRSSLITYEGLPVSSGGAHTLRKQDMKTQWDACQRFLFSCTDYRTPNDVHIILHEGAQVPEDFSGKIKKELSSWLGKPVRAHTISGAINEFTNWWHPQSVPLSTIIDWLVSHQPFPEHWLNAPLVLGIRANFRLKQHGSNTILAFQGSEYYLRQKIGQGICLGESQIYVRLSTRSTVFAFLTFPFLEANQEFWDYLAWLRSELPFRFSDNHLLRWRLNKQGSRFYGRKIHNARNVTKAA